MLCKAMHFTVRNQEFVEMKFSVEEKSNFFRKKAQLADATL
jgi:hypothetical protein